MKGRRKSVSRETSWKDRQEKEVLLEGADLLGIHVEPEHVHALLTYLAELREWNKKIKLIGPAKPGEQVVVHLLDSLIPLIWNQSDTLDLIDIGSGAGLPGIPLKVVRPGWNVTMVESRDKKAAFIRNAVRLLGLKGAAVLTNKISKISTPELANRFDARNLSSTWQPQGYSPLSQPMISDQGHILAYKGPAHEEELSEAKGEMERLGLVLQETFQVRLPFLNHDRFLLSFGKAE